MAPSIRVTQEVYGGLRRMIEASYGKTINGVIERFLKEEGVVPPDLSTVQSDSPQEIRGNNRNENRKTSFNQIEEEEFMSILGDPIPNYRFQRDAMKEVFSKFSGEKEKVINAYAWMDEKGYAPRKNNSHNFSSRYYAEALFNDGIRKGWLK